MIVDNVATHSHPEVKAWLSRHPRFVMHFTPTGASWLNMVERLFRDITDKACPELVEGRIRRDSFTSVAELQLAVETYVAHYNLDPKPFIWTAKATYILAKVSRAKATAPPTGQGRWLRAHYIRIRRASCLRFVDADASWRVLQLVANGLVLLRVQATSHARATTGQVMPTLVLPAPAPERILRR